jgi:hypothetical protein
MKITKRKLRQIIKENTSPMPLKSRSTPFVRAAVAASRRQRPLKENMWRHPKTGVNMLLMINELVDHMLNQGVDAVELANELRGLADDVEDSQYRAEYQQ